ncbi:MAG: PD-(D/E)XK nuclease family protein [Candidatus Binatia bacterium]
MSDHPLSFSQIKTFKRCPWLYNQTYNEGIRRATKGLKLAEGDFIHRLLAGMARGNDWWVTWASIKAEYEDAQLFEEEAEEVSGLADRVRQVVQRYEQMVWKPIFSKWTIIHIEEELGVINTVLGFPVVIKPDLVARSPEGQVWLIDHKTTRDFEDQLEENLQYDDQINLYLWGLRELGLNVVGAIHDMIRTRLPRFPGLTKKGLIDRRPCVTDEETIRAGVEEARASGAIVFDSDVADYLQNIKHHEFFKLVTTFRSDLMLDKLAEEYRLTKWMIDAHAQIKAWPRTFIPRDCPRCPVRELCMADLHGADTDALMETTYRRRGEEARAPEIPTDLTEEVA